MITINKEEIKRKNILSSFLNIPSEKLILSGKNSFSYNKKDFLILKDKESYKEAKSYIEDNLIYFDTEDIIHICNVTDADIIKDIIYAINSKDNIKSTLSEENANIIIKKCINKSFGFSNFVDKLIKNNGRGQFITPAYPEETKYNDFYIYRID